MKRIAMLAATFFMAATFGSLAYATVPEANAPKPNGKYFVIVKENDPAPSVDGNPRKIYKEPDISKHGGKLLKKYDRTLVIELPSSSADALCADENVAYLQRIWDEDSTDGPSSDDLCPKAKKKSGVQSDSESNLTWETGQYLYDGSGNIKKIGDDVYTYDKAGRLVAAFVKGKTENYKYDSFGNLTEKTITGQATTVNRIDGSSNRLVGETYDAAGALLTRDGATRYSYDSVGMVTMIRPPFQTGRRMIYGADDERVGELIGTNYSRWQFRDLQGRVLRDYKDDGIGYWLWSEDYIYGDGKLVAGEREDYHGGIRHYHLDHLGSTRMVTNSDRMRYGLHDYYPFGVEQTATLQEKDNFGSDRPGPKKFTGHERDFIGLTNVENTDYLDYMHARYYDPNVGRFLSVDPSMDIKKNLPEPQHWNRYAYVTNNPLRYTDPDGRDRYQEPGFTKPYSEWGEALQMDENTPTVVKVSNYAAGGLTALGAAGFMGAGSALTSIARFGMALASRLTMGATAAEMTRRVVGDSNRMNHIFGNPGHKLDGLVRAFGSADKVVGAVSRAVLSAGKLQTNANGVFSVVVKIGGQNVEVRGRVVKDVIRVADFWVK